jgi:dienelactone hydrolase
MDGWKNMKKNWMPLRDNIFSKWAYTACGHLSEKCHVASEHISVPIPPFSMKLRYNSLLVTESKIFSALKIRLRRFLPLVISLFVVAVSCEKREQDKKEKKQPGVMLYWKARIKDGKTQEAIPAGMEAIDYFTAKYPSASVRSYIESSDGIQTVHIFTAYKDRDTYEKTRSQYIKDEKWMALYRSLVVPYMVPGTIQFTLLTSPSAFVQEKPVADLEKGQEGKIFFSSINLGSFREILAGEGQSKPVTILGTLSMPKNAKGKVPAVVIMHGAGGVNNHYFEVARIVNGIGIAAFVVDSFETRGIRSVQALKGRQLPRSFAVRISDAYAALELLSTHPKIDKRRIALMGYSHGGAVALFVASEKIRHAFIADDLRFAASVAYYAFCFPQIKDIDFTDAPILMLLAEKDNMAPAKPCLDYARRIKDSGADIKTIVYKDAHHQFPVLPGKKMIKVPEFADLSNCGQNEYWFLRNDGTWYSPYLGKTYAEVDSGNIATDCRKDGEAAMAGNEAAKAKSIRDFKAFLKNVFHID